MFWTPFVDFPIRHKRRSLQPNISKRQTLGYGYRLTQPTNFQKVVFFTTKNFLKISRFLK